jgi:hypothetical protein
VLFAGNDWYINDNYDPDKYDENDKSTYKYKWFEGSDEKDGYSHLGEYLVKYNKKENTLYFRYQNESGETLDLDSDRGKVFSILLAEGGFDEGEYGMLIMKLTIDNRYEAVNNGENNGLDKWFGSGDSYQSIIEHIDPNGNVQYNGIDLDRYEDPISYFLTAKKQRGAGEAMQQFAMIYNVTMQTSCYTRGILESYPGENACFDNPKQVFAYSHNPGTIASNQLRGGYSVYFDPSLTKLKLVTATDEIIMLPDFQAIPE